jgi:serine/threonine protein kinase
MPADKAGLPEVPYGTVVGNDYMIVRPLRRGAMGALYVVEQLSTAGHRALKILRAEYIKDETLFKRFERESQMAARIKSEHVTQVIAAGVDAKLQLPWIAMELLEGQNLNDHIDEHGPIPRATVRQIFEQLCHALSAAHAIGIVHRDLKPANIFLSDAHRIGAQKMVKVLDFGVAKIVAEVLTLTGAPLGTPNWMSPEQTRSDPATPASDVWALGLIAFYMLTGKIFWRASQTTVEDITVGVAVMKEIANDPIPIASMRALELGVADKIPPGFNEWFAQCVARSPDERFVTAAAAYAALASVLSK